MSTHITLDVIDRPAIGARAAKRRLAAIRRAGAPGLDALLVARTARFVTRRRPAPTVRRIATLAAWDGDVEVEVEVEDAWSQTLAALADGAREHWHVRGEIVRAAFSGPWRGWTPRVEGAKPLGDDEPALILISTDVRPRAIPGFARNGRLAVSHAREQPGYRGGLTLNTSPLNMTSCSTWRSYADARRYAFTQGGHAEAMRRDRRQRPERPEWFLRIRPLDERGTLDGIAPFAGAVTDRTALTAAAK